jgi:hypothetical protein
LISWPAGLLLLRQLLPNAIAKEQTSEQTDKGDIGRRVFVGVYVRVIAVL